MKYLVAILVLTVVACNSSHDKKPGGVPASVATTPSATGTSLIVLGTTQDAGYPHIGCQKDCCAALFKHDHAFHQVVCLGLYDSSEQKRYLFEATPDITTQMKTLSQFGHTPSPSLADGIFLSHAHIGHYTGLMYLGKEAIDADSIPVFAMPRMQAFLTNNGPWSQLVKRNNIKLEPLTDSISLQLSKVLQVTPFAVPHRDEYSETVGYRIDGPNKSALFIPDIDKWEKWEQDIVAAISEVDYAFLDATFFDAEEVNHRDISQIPHPFVSESLDKFAVLSPTERNKVVFIHFNHTNPLLQPLSHASRLVEKQGFRIARRNDVFPL